MFIEGLTIKNYRKALFIFRRDLRLEDNTGLLFALENAKSVFPCFIFTREQIDNNPYRNEHCLQFMLESLEDLGASLKEKKGRLHLFYGAPESIVEKLIKSLQIDAVVVNRDYTPYSLARDEKIAAVCKKNSIDFHSFEDALLHPVSSALKKDGKPYTVFTPFFQNARQYQVDLPQENPHHHYDTTDIPFAAKQTLFEKIVPKRPLPPSGGRKKALDILKNLAAFSNYKVTRELMGDSMGTTHLSPHLKFTTCSAREVYHAVLQALGPNADLIRSLYWRDFFTAISFYFPHVFQGAFHRKFNALTWKNDKKIFQKWCEGKTGFPMVDAGMRELNQTGNMHNRARMVAASFLVKDLHIDWQWGEKYFAQKLTDYDPAVNNGNWQWSASTGCDAQPYFRIFNPWLQAARFDPEAVYIKKWVPELADKSPKTIHKWYLEPYHYPSYPSPIVDHPEEAKKALAAFRSIC